MNNNPLYFTHGDNDKLRVGQRFRSSNGKYYAALETNGRLAIYMVDETGFNHQLIWYTYQSTDVPIESIRSIYLTLTSTGYLTVVANTPNSNQRILWRSESPGLEGKYYMVLGDDGNLCIYNGTPENQGDLHWSSYIQPASLQEDSEEIKNLKNTWLNKADYSNMKIGDSEMLYYFGKGKYIAGHGGAADPKTLDIGQVYSGILVTKNILGPTYGIIDKVSLINSHIDGNGNPLAALDIDIFSADAKAELGKTYIGAGIELTLTGGAVSIFDFHLGIGLEAGIGIKDDSFTVKWAGTGIQVGRKLSISAFGNSVGLDLGRVFKSIGSIF